MGPFVLDRQAETLVRWGIERVREIKQGKVPKRRYTNRCKVCSYRKECFGMANRQKKENYREELVVRGC